MKHFEHVWEEAEKVTREYLKDHDKIQLLERARNLLTIYQGFEESKDDPRLTKDYINFGKNKAMGDLLLILSALSDQDEINTYQSLDASIQNAKSKVKI